MPLKLLDSLSLPGDPAKANEDAWGHFDRAALVMDGATPLGDPLMPGPSDAAWIAQFGARRLIAHLKDGDAPDDALVHALTDADKSFTALSRHPIREKWQTPCASMMLVADANDEFEFLWFGDCAALVADGSPASVVGETIAKREQEAARAKQWAKANGLVNAMARPELLAKHRAGRNHVNSGRHWLFSPDVRAAAHVKRARHRMAPGAQLLLATDGFLALVSDYGAYDPDSLMVAVREKGLSVLGQVLRGIEDMDELAETYPRFKKSDDATVLLLEVV
jgi:hypothetical protein